MGSKNLLKAFFNTSLLCYGFLLFSFIFECSHNNFQIWSGHFSSCRGSSKKSSITNFLNYFFQFLLDFFVFHLILHYSLLLLFCSFSLSFSLHCYLYFSYFLEMARCLSSIPSKQLYIFVFGWSQHSHLHSVLQMPEK